MTFHYPDLWDMLWHLLVDSLLVLTLFSDYSRVVALSIAYLFTLKLVKPDERSVYTICLLMYQQSYHLTKTHSIVMIQTR